MRLLDARGKKRSEKNEEKCFEGEEIEIYGEIVDRNAKVMSLKQIMKYPDQELVLAESLLKFLVFDLKSRKSIRLDDEKLPPLLPPPRPPPPRR